MADIDAELIQNTLDALRLVRRILYSIPEAELGAMSLDDQIKYGNNLYQVGTAILLLEIAKIKGVNNKFKSHEIELRDAIEQLKSDVEEMEDAVEFIRLVSQGLNVLMKLIEFVQ